MAAMWQQVEYQQACEEGFDAEKCVEEEIAALEEEKAELESALEKVRSEAVAHFKARTCRARAGVENPTVCLQVDQLKASVEYLKVATERAFEIQSLSAEHLERMEPQWRALKERLDLLRQKQKKQNESDPLFDFIDESSRRMTQKIAKR